MLLASLQIQQVVVEDVCTINQLADSRQEVDMLLATYVDDIQNTQTELANCKVSSLLSEMSMDYHGCVTTLIARMCHSL